MVLYYVIERSMEISSGHYNQLVHNFWEDARTGNMQKVFFKTENTDSMHAFLDNLYIEFSKTVKVFRSSYTPKKQFSPYYPFLAWISDQLKSYKENEIESTMNKAGVYLLHRPIIAQYILSGTVSRKEPMLDDELIYEKHMMLRSIWKLFLFLFRYTPLIIILEELQYHPFSSLEMISYIFNEPENNPFLVIISYNPNMHRDSETDQEVWLQFLEHFETTYPILSFVADYNTYSEPIKLENSQPNLHDIINAYYFLCLKDAKSIIQKLSSNKEIELKIDPTEKQAESIFEMYMYFGHVLTLDEEYDEAIRNYQMSIKIANRWNMYEDSALGNIYLANVYFHKQYYEQSLRAALQGLKFSQKHEKTNLMLLAIHLLLKNESKTFATASDIWRKYFPLYLELAEAQQNWNMLSYWYAYPYGLHQKNNFNIYSEYLDKAIQLSKYTGNELRLSSALQRKGIIHAYCGEFNHVMDFYSKSKKLQKNIGDINELIRITNSIGYYHYLTGNFSKARSNYRKALQLLKQTYNLKEICLSLYNLILTHLLSFHHQAAVKTIGLFSRLMKILDMKDLSIHSQFHIYAVTGLCYYKNGSISKAYDFWTRIIDKSLEPDPLQDSETLLYLLFNAMIKDLQEDREAALRFFEEAEIFIYSHPDTIKFLIPRFYYEYSLFWRKNNYPINSNHYLDIGYEFAKKENNTFYIEVFKKECNGIEFEPPRIHSHLENDFSWIINAAKNEQALKKLHKSLHNIDFLRSYQTIISLTKSKDTLIKKTIELITGSFLVDNCYFFYYENKIARLLDSITIADTQDVDIYPLINYIDEYDQEQIIYSSSADRVLAYLMIPFTNIISIPLTNKRGNRYHMLCCATGEYVRFGPEDLNYLSITSYQLIRAVDEIDQEEEIKNKNIELEQKVEERTVELKRSFDKIEKQRQEIQLYNQELERLVKERTDELVESEKLAALGGLVSGLAHEINTPLGIGVTSVSFMHEKITELHNRYQEGTMKRSDLERFLQKSEESAEYILMNLKRVSELVQSFKKLSIDQSTQEKRFFNVKEYIHYVLLSLRPRLKKTNHTINIDCDEQLEVYSDPGLFSQVITNLIMNSLIHGFENIDAGIIIIKAWISDSFFQILYSDSGKGMDTETKKNMFNPFFTTKRGAGNTGLGMHIISNIITQNYGGKISCTTQPHKGVEFKITIPIESPKREDMQ